MKKTYLSILFVLISVFVFGQDKLNVEIVYALEAPELDGKIDEAYAIADSVPIDQAYGAENPTVSAYWKALWDENYIYVMISVEDDDHWPGWESGGGWYEYDVTEVYFDVNEELNDGGGINTTGTGHYQAVAKFADGIDGEVQNIEVDDRRPRGQFCYLLDGENYVIEYAIEIASLVNGAGEPMTAMTIKEMGQIGFDVCIADQDEGITSGRQRAVWSNTGSNGENYLNMDDAGTITFIDKVISVLNKKVSSIFISPNPANNYLNIDAVFDKVVIYNTLGKEIRTLHTSNNVINISDLSEGIYLVQVYNSESLLGMEKIVKK